MKKAEALNRFFNSFGIPAYPISAVPDEKEITFPYMTFENVLPVYGGETASITVNLWYKTESETVITDKVEEIAEFIGLGGSTVVCDNGFLWIKRGSPFSVPIVETDPSYKRRALNIELEFI